MLRTVSRWLRTSLALAVLLAIPAYAMCSLMHGGAPQSGNVALAENDDVVQFGLGIVAPPAHAEASMTSVRPESDIVLLTDWTFTSKGKPLPYK